MYKRPSRAVINPVRRRSPGVVRIKSPNSATKERAARTIQMYWRGTRSTTPIHWVLFSGTAQCMTVPNLTTLYQKPIPELVTEVTVRRGKEIQSVHTREYGYSQTGYFDSASSIVYKGMFGDRAFAVMVFKSGKVTFTGGYPENTTSMYQTPRMIVRSILGPVKAFKIVSSMIQLRTNLKLTTSLFNVQTFLRRSYSMDVRPEETITSFITVNISPESVRIFKNGQFQILKVTSPLRAKIATARVKRMIQELVAGGFYEAQDGGVPEKKRKTSAQQRHTGNIAPNIQKRSTTCPKDKRPTPYSFGGEPIGPGYYIGANPQGLPCCYKIPKKIAYLRPKIIQRFNELGIRIPASTKKAFEIVLNNANKPVNVSNKEPLDIPIFIDKGELKIGTRQAKRWPLVKLVDIARKLGSSDVGPGMPKIDVIEEIERLAQRKGIIGQNMMRINGRRNIRHFTKKNLYNRVKKVYGVRLNTSKNMKSLVENVQKLQKSAMIRRVFNNMVPSGPRINENKRIQLRAALVENAVNEKTLRSKLNRELNQGLMNLIRRN